VRLEDVRWEGETLRIEGHAYIEMIGAARRRSQKIEVVARSTDSRRLQLRLETTRVHRPDVTGGAAQQLVSLDWSGFVATLDPGRLRAGLRRRSNWRIGVVVRAGGVVRESWHPEPAALHAPPAAELFSGGARIRAGLTPSGELELRFQRAPPVVRSYALESDVLQLEGYLDPVVGAEPRLRASGRSGAANLEYPLELGRAGERSAFLARIPIDDLVREQDVAGRAIQLENEGNEIAWDLLLVGDKGRRRLALHGDMPESAWTLGPRQLALERSRYGNLRIVQRSCLPVVTGVEWTPAGNLTLTGSFRGPPGEYDLLLRGRRSGEVHAVPLHYDAEAGLFTAEVRPDSVTSPTWARPLTEGAWEFHARPRGGAPATSTAVLLAHQLLDRLPLTARGRKRFRFGVAGYDHPLLVVERHLDDDERGGFRQRSLRTAFYGAQRQRGLRDAVLYECFSGRECGDSPRAIHEELVRRKAPFQHLWVIRDGACTAPETAVAVRELSKEYYEAYASARYVVANDHWPSWALRRTEQTWLQTWHGAPLKSLGHDLARRPKALREYRRLLRQPSESWQYLVSPGGPATPILRRAFPACARVLETGLPRTDLLLRPDRDRRADDVRRRLGVVPGQRVVLYAPTYRDHLAAGEGYRLGPVLDLVALRSALGEDEVLLFRKHRLVVGSLAEDAARSVLDVSDVPDATELLLAVDVLVTDYSSAIFDFAVTGRPMVFFTPDLATYRDEIRGFSIDFEAEAPGPLLRTAAEVVDAVRDPDAVRAAFADRYDRFVASYCALADGRASDRVVEDVFRW
jgi:CDP-glycerol glycerophosphotransferase